MARAGRARCARHVLSQALRRQARDSRRPPRARGAIPGGCRGASCPLSRHRADEHEPGTRLVPPPPARPCDPARRARPRLGRGSRGGAARGAAMRTLCFALVVLAASSCGDARASAASWVGSFRLPASAEPVEMLVRLDGRTASVFMGYGHAARVVLPVQSVGLRLRFTLPAGLRFDGRVHGRAVSGTVRQGAVHGTFRVAQGTSRVLPLFGLYRSSAGEAVAVVRARGYPAWLVELDSGRVHGIGPSLTVGSLLGETSGDGSIAARPGGIAWKGTTYDRVALRQREVRVGANAATLPLPPGSGPFPAVAMVHGSGATTREEFQVFAAWCASLGIAVLADDKRGVGQSTGAYPGERASGATLDLLARDTQREVRYLASLPNIDKSRIGVLGDSQAGWIIALAASREPLVRWALPLVGPTVTVDQSDTWGSIAGKSDAPPTGTRPAMLAQTCALGEGGFDPRPLLAKLSIPVFWIFGDDDRNVPTELCVDALKKLKAGHDFPWTVLPMTHALFLLPDGLYASLSRSPGFAPGLYPAVAGWLRSRGIAR